LRVSTTSRDGRVRLWNWGRISDNPIVLYDRDLGDWAWSGCFSVIGTVWAVP